RGCGDAGRQDPARAESAVLARPGHRRDGRGPGTESEARAPNGQGADERHRTGAQTAGPTGLGWRSEEHTSELQSRFDLVCRLLLEKIKRVTSALAAKRPNEPVTQ